MHFYHIILRMTMPTDADQLHKIFFKLKINYKKNIFVVGKIKFYYCFNSSN